MAVVNENLKKLCANNSGECTIVGEVTEKDARLIKLAFSPSSNFSYGEILAQSRKNIDNICKNGLNADFSIT